MKSDNTELAKNLLADFALEKIWFNCLINTLFKLLHFQVSNRICPYECSTLLFLFFQYLLLSLQEELRTTPSFRPWSQSLSLCSLGSTGGWQIQQMSCTGCDMSQRCHTPRRWCTIGLWHVFKARSSSYQSCAAKSLRWSHFQPFFCPRFFCRRIPNPVLGLLLAATSPTPATRTNYLSRKHPSTLGGQFLCWWTMVARRLWLRGSQCGMSPIEARPAFWVLWIGNGGHDAMLFQRRKVATKNCQIRTHSFLTSRSSQMEVISLAKWKVRRLLRISELFLLSFWLILWAFQLFALSARLLHQFQSHSLQVILVECCLVKCYFDLLTLEGHLELSAPNSISFG